jgi:hypothetical protein
MLDNNLAMDRNRIEYVGRLPHGQALVDAALEPEVPVLIDRLEQRFGVQMMLKTPKDHGFLASLLYYFGVLTYTGRDFSGQLQMVTPNLVVRKLYVERMQEALLPGYEVTEERQSAARHFYTTGELQPLADFIEQRLLPVFDNRDLRWSNELTLKTAFLTTLFNDTAYIMDSETAIDTCPERSRRKGYGDLSLIVRPDMRQYALLDHLLEFKYVALKDLPGLDSRSIAQIPREELRTHALVGIGLTRLVW